MEIFIGMIACFIGIPALLLCMIHILSDMEFKSEFIPVGREEDEEEEQIL